MAFYFPSIQKKEKQGFIFFAHLKKKTDHSNYNMLWKISNLIDSKFPVNRTPPPQSLLRIEGGGKG